MSSDTLDSYKRAIVHPDTIRRLTEPGRNQWGIEWRADKLNAILEARDQKASEGWIYYTLTMAGITPWKARELLRTARPPPTDDEVSVKPGTVRRLRKSLEEMQRERRERAVD